MAKRGKAKDSVNNGIEAYRHEADKRKNAVPVGLASYDTSKPKPKKYEYDPHLDPPYGVKFSSNFQPSVYKEWRFSNESI
jgi:hypothetical protein